MELVRSKARAEFLRPLPYSGPIQGPENWSPNVEYVLTAMAGTLRLYYEGYGGNSGTDEKPRAYRFDSWEKAEATRVILKGNSTPDKPGYAWEVLEI